MIVSSVVMVLLRVSQHQVMLGQEEFTSDIALNRRIIFAASPEGISLFVVALLVGVDVTIGID